MGRDTILALTRQQYRLLCQYVQSESTYALEEIATRDPARAYRLILEYYFQGEVSRVSFDNAVVADFREDSAQAAQGAGAYTREQLESQIGNTNISIMIFVRYRRKPRLTFVVPQYPA